MDERRQLLATPVEHLDLQSFDPVPLVEAMGKMSFTARDLSRASQIYDLMLGDRDCAVILCLAGSLVSAGLKQILVTLIESDMVDAVVSTGANIVDQDFFEGLGFRHYVAPEIYRSGLFDDQLRDLMIDRIYDTFIDEQELRGCDHAVKEVADALEPRPYSSREFIVELGKYLGEQDKRIPSIISAAFTRGVPIFCPALSDSSAGLGIVAHIEERRGRAAVSFDSAKDFWELTQVKIRNPTTGLLMVGGGVPKNFAQDIVVAADILGHDAPMHKYAVQISVADARDGALSGSTLKEAASWGKVDTGYEQMVFSEATVALPLIAGYAYCKGSWRQRTSRRFNDMLEALAKDS
jgi:deoxyhypusine synthase